MADNSSGKPAKALRREQREVSTRPLNLVSKQGSSGKEVDLKANYFILKSSTTWCLYQYRVDIAPDEDRTQIRKALLREHREALGFYLFDGTVLFTPNRYPQPYELNSIREDDRQPMNIKFRLVGDLVKGDYQYLQLFNMLVRKCLEHLKLQLVGRHYYDALNRIEIPAFKLQLWSGMLTSIRQHEYNVMMCTEVSHKVMRDETVHDILKTCFNDFRQDYQSEFKKEVMGKIVLTAYNNKTYRIDDVDFGSNPKHEFDLKGQKISYAEYYKSKYGLTIQYLGQPLLVSVARARDRRAGNNELIYLIPELCRSTGLTDKMRANFQLMKALADHTRVSPANRMQRLLKFNESLNKNAEVIQEFKQWNFVLDDKLVDVRGRILPKEKIIFGNGVEVAPENADWNFPLQEKPAFMAGAIKDWIAIVPQRCVGEAKNFLTKMMNNSTSMRIEIARPRLIEIPDDRVDTYVKALEQMASSSNPRMVFCVVTSNQTQRYAAIKKKLCIDRPIPSQIVLARTLQQKSESRFKSVGCKVATQMNCKLGGYPWTLHIAKYVPGLMVVGYDVCHNKNGTDFGAMVASLDMNFGRFYSAVSHHPSNEELSNNMAVQLGNALKEFRRVNDQKLPSRVLIYRDGVGEGQLDFVYNYEVDRIKSTLSAIYQHDDYKLGFIIVTKRINTRIFFNQKNAPPGTVVDDVITDPLKYDFFIVSQNVHEGTVAPTAYNVLEDTLGLSPDKIQLLTFKFCHMYYNFSGAVRVPAPCQYAHKLAFFISTTIKQPAHQKLQTTLYFL